MGFGVWGYGDEGLTFRVWGLRYRIWVYGSDIMICS
jgi:hypothetical protein